jgi:hypothetical protein
VPDVTIDAVSDALLALYAKDTTLVPVTLSAPELAAANDVIARYRV